MMEKLIVAGFLALQDYIATHVLTCLVPAFFLAGAIVTFVRKEAIIRYLGEGAGKIKSFSLASISSFMIAACSCTVIPVASGLFYGGAGVGVAFIILWVAPASNILALTYTGTILGSAMVISRIVAALLMAFVIGFVMTAFFGKRDDSDEGIPKVFPGEEEEQIRLIGRNEVVLLVLIVLSLLSPNYFVQKGPYLQKVLVWGGFTLATAVFAMKVLTREQIVAWLRETWWFVRIILPLLLVGVFIVGIIGVLIPEEWIRTWLGGNSLSASFLATMLGAVSYFATMTEAPFVDTLMNLGMGKGPALTLLLTGPGCSLPNWIATARVFGLKRAVVYVITIIILGTLMGWFFGNFIL